MQEKIIIEVCVDNVESAIIAINAGAHRLELCSSLSEGGLTPSKGLLEYVISHSKIPVNVLIRPRNGDFFYSPAEYQVIKSDIFAAKVAGAAGIVIGMLNSDASVDTCRMKEIIDMCNPLPVTFHRAFDMVTDPYIALEKLIEIGCARILTSGQKHSASSGAALIAELKLISGNRIIIMPGSGINEKNFPELVEYTGCKEYHLSASGNSTPKMKYLNESLINYFPPTYKIAQQRDLKEICRLASELSI